MKSFYSLKALGSLPKVLHDYNIDTLFHIELSHRAHVTFTNFSTPDFQKISGMRWIGLDVVSISIVDLFKPLKSKLMDPVLHLYENSQENTILHSPK